MWQAVQSWPAARPWWLVEPGVLIVTPYQTYGYSWQLSQVAAPTAVCAAVLPFMFMPTKEVNTVAEWHFSQLMPTVGTWVEADGAVGEPPAASGVTFGW